MKTNGNPDRLRHLAVAFRRIAESTPELRVDPPSVRSVPAVKSEVGPIFRVRLRSSNGDAQARMYVHDRGAKLETRVGSTASGRGAKDELPIDLRRGYRWEKAEFDDAAQLADVLYKHMTRRLEAAAGEAN